MKLTLLKNIFCDICESERPHSENRKRTDAVEVYSAPANAKISFCKPCVEKIINEFDKT